MQPCQPNPYKPESQEFEVQALGAHFLSRWSTLDGSNEPLPETPELWGEYQLGRTPNPTHCGSRLWSVALWGYESERIVLGGSVANSPDAQVLAVADDQAAYEVNNQHSRLKAKIAWGTASGGNVRVVDLAQGIRLSLEATHVQVTILYPQPGRPISTGATQKFEVAGPGYILDTLVGGVIAPTLSTPGMQLATNTYVQRIPAGSVDVPIFLPPGTRWVSAYQTNVGNAITPTWRLRRNSVAVGPSLGSIFTGATRNAIHVPRPGAAGAITSGPADVVDRIVTWVFELEI